MKDIKIIPPGQDYRSLVERNANIDVSSLLEEYDKKFGSTSGGEEAKPKSKKILALVCGVLALGLVGGGWWGFGPEGAPLTRSVGVSDVVVSETVKEKPVAKDPVAVSEEKANAEKAKLEAGAKAKAESEAKAKLDEEAKAAKAKESDEKPKEEPVVVETQAVPGAPVADAVSKIIKTPNGTEIFEFKDKNLPPYEKPACGIGAEGCVEKGLSPADSYTGNNMNDDYLAYRLNLGYRKLGGIDDGFVSKELIVSAMTDNLTRLKLDIPVPSSPDYASARLYSSGYSLWPISKGYTLIYGDSHGLGIIGPDKDGKSFDAVLKSSKEVLISQSYSGMKAITFAPLSKLVSGSVIPDKEGEWQ